MLRAVLRLGPMIRVLGTVGRRLLHVMLVLSAVSSGSARTLKVQVENVPRPLLTTLEARRWTEANFETAPMVVTEKLWSFLGLAIRPGPMTWLERGSSLGRFN